MSRYIDADALAYIVASNGDADFINKVTRLMIDAPSIDIVRCKECIKRMRDDCPMCNCCKLDRVPTEDDDFCSYGEREGE